MEFELAEYSGISCWQLAEWRSEGVIHGFLGADLDVMAPEALRRFSDAMLAPDCRLRLLAQEHGCRIVSSDDPQELPAADAWLCEGSNTAAPPRICLGIITADCYPVLCLDRQSGALGAAHCGWRGCVDGLLPRLLDRLISGGAKPENLQVAIGPGAGAERYEVDQSVAARIEAAAASAGAEAAAEGLLRQTRPGHFLCDLKRLLELQAGAAGLAQEAIAAHPACTISNVHFFSYRRQKSLAGRQLSFISPARDRQVL